MTESQQEYTALAKARDESKTGSVQVTFPSGATWTFINGLDENGFPVWYWSRVPSGRGER